MYDTTLINLTEMPVTNSWASPLSNDMSLKEILSILYASDEAAMLSRVDKMVPFKPLPDHVKKTMDHRFHVNSDGGYHRFHVNSDGCYIKTKQPSEFDTLDKDMFESLI